MKFTTKYLSVTYMRSLSFDFIRFNDGKAFYFDIENIRKNVLSSNLDHGMDPFDVLCTYEIIRISFDVALSFGKIE